MQHPRGRSSVRPEQMVLTHPVEGSNPSALIAVVRPVYVQSRARVREPLGRLRRRTWPCSSVDRAQPSEGWRVGSTPARASPHGRVAQHGRALARHARSVEGSNPSASTARACSSAGRVPSSHGGSRGFESRQVHHLLGDAGIESGRASRRVAQAEHREPLVSPRTRRGRTTGCGAAWQRARLGAVRPGVRISPPRSAEDEDQHHEENQAFEDDDAPVVAEQASDLLKVRAEPQVMRGRPHLSASMTGIVSFRSKGL